MDGNSEIVTHENMRYFAEAICNMAGWKVIKRGEDDGRVSKGKFIIEYQKRHINEEDKTVVINYDLPCTCKELRQQLYNLMKGI